MTIDQRHPRAVHRSSLDIASVGNREFEPVVGKFVDRGLRSR